MEATPGNSPPKRSRAKTATQTPATKAPRKTLSASRKKAVEPPPEIIAESLTATDLRDMIETAAFYRAAARSFAPGHEFDDWLEAEREILARFA